MASFNIGGLLGCVRGRHARSAERVRREGEHLYSVCEHCGVRMRRLAKRRWVVERSHGF